MPAQRPPEPSGAAGPRDPVPRLSPPAGRRVIARNCRNFGEFRDSDIKIRLNSLQTGAIFEKPARFARRRRG